MIWFPIIVFGIALAIGDGDTDFDLRHGAKIEYDDETRLRLTNEGETPIIELRVKFD